MKGRTPKRLARIEAFDLQPGRILARKYEVVGLLGAGWEGEVYKVRELSTGIEHAAKFFFPHRNERDRALKFYAKKLHKLRRCPILIQYYTQEQIAFRGHRITFLVSEFVDGEIVNDFLLRQPGKRLTPFEGIHLLHSLADGIAAIHAMREYHGDLHTGNIIVRRHGLGFYVRLVDLFQWDTPRPSNIHDDVIDLVRILYDVTGGAKRYSKQPRVIKDICCGLKRTRILEKFRTAGRLRDYLENLEWENAH